jgi:hypothetical protein
MVNIATVSAAALSFLPRDLAAFEGDTATFRHIFHPARHHGTTNYKTLNTVFCFSFS